MGYHPNSIFVYSLYMATQINIYTHTFAATYVQVFYMQSLLFMGIYSVGSTPEVCFHRIHNIILMLLSLNDVTHNSWYDKSLDMRITMDIILWYHDVMLLICPQLAAISQLSVTITCTTPSKCIDPDQRDSLTLNRWQKYLCAGLLTPI